MTDTVEDPPKKTNDKVAPVESEREQDGATVKLSDVSLGRERNSIIKESEQKQAQDLLGKIKGLVPAAVLLDLGLDPKDKKPEDIPKSKPEIREVRAADNTITKYDNNNKIVEVDRADGHKIQIKRAENGDVLQISDSKGPVLWESKDGKTFVRKGDANSTISGSPDIKENGDYSFNSPNSVLSRTKDGATVTTADGTVLLKDDGSSIVSNAQGQVESATTTKGLELSVKREKDPANPEQAGKIFEAKIGAQVWTRSKEAGTENVWTSNDGMQRKGEFSLDKDGNMHFVDAQSKAELINKLDGSTIERDKDNHVLKVVSSEGLVNSYSYTPDGKLKAMKLGDGTSFTRLSDAKSANETKERWIQDGSSKITIGSRSVNSDGDLSIKNAGEKERLIRSNGWEESQDQSGKTQFTKTNLDKSTITKNNLDQITETRTANGQIRNFGYDDSGNLNSVELGKEGKWNSNDGGKTWSKDGSNPIETKEASFSFTPGGDLIEQAKKDGKNDEYIRKTDGSVLHAENGLFISQTNALNQESKIQYNEHRQPIRFEDSSDKGAYWTSKDNKSWDRHNADGTLDQTNSGKKFSVAFDSQGNLLKQNQEKSPPTIERKGTDGSETIADFDGRKLSERKPEPNGQFVETTFRYDESKKFLGKETHSPDGTVLSTDAQGRVSDVRKGDFHRSFVYENPKYPNLISSFEDNGSKYSLNLAALEKGQVEYANQDPAKANDIRKGIFNAEKDGSMVIRSTDGFELKDRIDGSKLVRLESGAVLDYRADGKLNSSRDANGSLTQYKYEMQADMFGRKDQLSAITYGEGANAVTHRTSDGFNWRQDGSNKEWKGFITVNPGEGSILYRNHHGDATEQKLDGTKLPRKDLSVKIDSATDEIRKTVDYWYNSSALKDIKPQLHGRTAEEIQMIKAVYAERQGRDLTQDLWDRFDHGADTHRWAEVEGLLNRKGTTKDAINAEENAVQLAVDAKEMNRWWWNRDRSQAAIAESTRMVMGNATEDERKNMAAAYQDMYKTSLESLYQPGGAGNAIKTWDGYTETLINTSLKKGKDLRTPQEEAAILRASLNTGLDNFMEASGAIVSANGRKEFLANGGVEAIRNAFTYESDESGPTTNEWQVRQATDFAETGALRPGTAIIKANGIFSNDEKVIQKTLDELSPEQRAQFADGKALVESNVSRDALKTDSERASFDFYKGMMESFKSLHYFGKDKKAEKYIDQSMHQGGTDLANKVAPIGGHWTNSSQINANAIESMDQNTFNTLMAGAHGRVDADGSIVDKEGRRLYDRDGKAVGKGEYLSEFHQQMAEAMQKNLGSAYLKDARELLDRKIAAGIAINASADSGDLASLRAKIPQLANMSDEKFAQLSAGYKLEKDIRSGTLTETKLKPADAQVLDAYRKDTSLRPFMDGREVARQLDDIESGARAQRLFSGREAAESGKSPSAEEQKAIDFYKANAAEIEGLTRNQIHQVIERQRESFNKQLSAPASESLQTYQKTLYDTVQQSSRRDILTAIHSNESVWGNDRKAMLDSLLSLNADERTKIKNNTDNYGSKLRQELTDKFAGGSTEDPRYKLVDSLLKQIESSNKAVPDAATMGPTEKLLALAAGIASNDKKDAVGQVSELLHSDKDGTLAAKLLQDKDFKRAAIAALGGREESYNSLIKPLLENGRLASATLKERNTEIVENGDGPGTAILNKEKFFKEGVLDASAKALKFLNSPEGQAEKEQLLAELKSSPKLQKLAEEIIKQGEVRQEDRIRAFVLGAGSSKEQALETMKGMTEPERMAMQKQYEDKYENFRASVLGAVGENKDYDEFFRATRSHDWTTQQAFLNSLQQVIKTNDGFGGAIARQYNVTDIQDLNKFAQLKFEASVQGKELDQKTQEQIERLVEDSVKSFKETKQATADTLVTGAITTGSLALAPFTGGTSLYGLIGISTAMGVSGAGLKYAMMGNDTEGTRQFLGDSFKYTALAFANQLGPSQVSKAFGFGEGVAAATTTNALAKAGIEGASAEVTQQVQSGMLRLVQEGFEHGGVTNKAIEEMVQSVSGLSATAKSALSAQLQAALPNAVRAEMETAVAQVLQTMRLRGQSLAYQAVVGGAGNVVGEAGRQVIDNGKLDAGELQSAFVQGAVFAGAIGSVLTGAGWVGRQVSNRLKEVHAPSIAGAEQNAAKTVVAGGVTVTAIEAAAHLKKPIEVPKLIHPNAGTSAADELRTVMGHANLVETPHLPSGDHPLLVNESIKDLSIPRPGDLELARLNKTVPELASNVADEFSERLGKLRDSWKEDLSREVKQAQELAPKVNDAHKALDAQIEKLQKSGASPAEIEAAKLDAKHPLNEKANVYESNQHWKTLAEQHASLTNQIKEVTNARVRALQDELNAFTKEHNLPHIEVALADKMHAAGGYSFGKGLMTLPREALAEANGTFGLSKVAFHEVVHGASQDPLIIRNAERLAASEGKAGNAEAIKSHYKEATGRDLDDKWLSEVSKQNEGKAPLTADEISRAESLAKAVKESRTDVSVLSEELGNNARIIESRLNDLKANADGKAVDRLFEDLYGQSGGERLAARLFGEAPVSPELEQAIVDWHASKISSGAQAFDSEAARQSIIKQLQAEAEHVQSSRQKLLDGYTGSAIEREAYGLDHQVSEPIGKRPLPEENYRISTEDGIVTGNESHPINESIRRNQPESLSEEMTNIAAPSASNGDILQREAKKTIASELRRRGMSDWEVTEANKHTSGDRAGIDLILHNKKTGEWYPIDITLRDKERKSFAITVPEDGKNFVSRRLTPDGQQLIIDKIFGDAPGKGIINEQKALAGKLKQLDDLAMSKYGRTFRDIIQDPLSATDTELRMNTLKDMSVELGKDPSLRELQRYVNNAKEYVERELTMNRGLQPAFESFVNGGIQVDIKNINDNITIREDGQLIGYKLEAGIADPREFLGGDVVNSLRNSVRDLRANGNLDAAAEARLQKLETNLAEIENRQTKIARINGALSDPSSGAAKSVLKSEVSTPAQIKTKADELLAAVEDHLKGYLGSRDAIHWQGVKRDLENIKKTGAISSPDEMKAFMEVRLAQETQALRNQFQKDILPIVGSNLNWNEYASDITKQAAFANNPGVDVSVAELLAHNESWDARTVAKGENFDFSSPILKETIGDVPVEIQPGAKYQGTRLSYKEQNYPAGSIEYFDKVTNEFVVSSGKNTIRVPAKDSKIIMGIPANGDASLNVFNETKHLSDILKSKQTVDAEIAKLAKERPGLEPSTEYLKMRARKLFNTDAASINSTLAEIDKFDGTNPDMLRKVAQDWNKIPEASQRKILTRLSELDDSSRAIAKQNLEAIKDISVNQELRDWINL